MRDKGGGVRDKGGGGRDKGGQKKKKKQKNSLIHQATIIDGSDLKCIKVQSNFFLIFFPC